MTKSIGVSIVITLLMVSCAEESTSTSCDQIVLINDELFMNGPEDNLQIISAEIVGNCLEISYSASGCDGNSWIVALYASEAVAESFPVQRFIRLSLVNMENCLAVFTKNTSFDLMPLQLESYNTIIFNLEDFNQQLRYEY